MRLGELCDINGFLAQYRGDYPVPGEPARMDVYAVSDFDLSDYSDGVDRHNVRRLIGQVPHAPNMGWAGIVSVNGTGQTYVDPSSWRPEHVRREIAKPRDGKEYTWRWSEVGTPHWVKDGFPQCGECCQWHDPAHLWCDDCDRCRPVKHRCTPR